jgi:hypothetical protein
MCSDGARLQVVVDVGGFRVLLIDAQQKKVDPVKQGLFSIDDRALANLLWAVDVAEKDIAVMQSELCDLFLGRASVLDAREIDPTL